MLREYLQRQIDWSKVAFGLGKRTGGICQHIEKELVEIQDDPNDRKEWIDVLILGMDGYWRHGGTPETLEPELLAKQTKNMNRAWPTPGPEDVASLHVRNKIYIAARFSIKEHAKALREDLEEMGYEVTSRWLNAEGSEESEGISQFASGKADLDQVRQWAKDDLADIDAADILILMTQDPLKPFHRGGRMVEFGYALAKGKTIWICGPLENVFTPLAHQRFQDAIDLVTTIPILVDQTTLK